MKWLEDARSPEGRSIPWLYGVAIALAMLLLRQPYRGVRHDGALYMGQALAHLNPQWAAHDFFFAGGSQDRFSIFSTFFSWLMSAVGLHPSEVVVLLAARVAMLAGLFLLTAGFPPLHRWLMVGAIACLAHFYGSGRTFAVMEPFVTARTVAEPISVFALAALLHGRRVFSLALLLLGASVHPLVAVPTAIVMWIYLVLVDRRWLWMALLVLPVLGLSLAGIQPLDGLLHTYDDEWFGMVMVANPSVFESNWTQRDLAYAALDAAIILFAVHGRLDGFSRVCRAALLAAALSCAICFCGADFMHGILVTQLQLWRCLWIVNVLSGLCFPLLVFDEWKKGGNGRLAALAVFLLAPAVQAYVANGWVLTLWIVATLMLSRLQVSLKPAILKLAMIATTLGGLLAITSMVTDILYELGMHVQGLAISSPASIPFVLPILTLPIMAFLMGAWRSDIRERWMTSTVVLCILAGSIVQWDQRSAWTRYVETDRKDPPPFDQLIPATAQVYWHDTDLSAIWYLLRRPSFSAPGQFAGVLFNRATAMNAMSRIALIQPISAAREKCTMLEGYTRDETLHFRDCEVQQDDFFRFCTSPAAHADFLIADIRFDRARVSQWTPTLPDQSQRTYYLYDCSKLR